MKVSLSVLFTIVFAITWFNTFSQDTCKVLKPEISGKYTGDCKNGLADGKGVAVGKDKYEGKFKKGLPNGQGTYTWSTGEVYKGSWDEGKKDGEGKYTFKSHGVDSTTTGFWKNDVFARKKIPSPYNVHRVDGIKRYTVNRFVNDTEIIISPMRPVGNWYCFVIR